MKGVCEALILSIAGGDLYMKEWVEKNIPTHKDREILSGKLLLRKVHNSGMMMNFADDHKKLVRIMSVIVTIFTAIVHFSLYGETGYEKEQAGIAFILGGAISNTIDRIRRGYVVDYLAFNTNNKKHSRITYNIGDFAIFAGAFLILISSFIKKK